MKVYIDRENKNIEVNFNGNAAELLSRLGINPDAVLIVRNNELIIEDEVLKESDNIKIISVVSGG